VLISKLGPEGDSFLLDIAGTERGTNWFAAVNLLLAHRSAGTAFLLMRNLEISAALSVSDDGSSFRGGSFRDSSGVTDAGGPGRAPGYPPLAYYYLSGSAWTGSVVLAPGPSPIYYRRIPFSPGESPAGPTHLMDGPRTRDRLRYIAALGNFEQSMPLNAQEVRSAIWRGQVALDVEIQAFKRDILHRHSILVRMLMDAHLLTAEEASAVPLPKIEVQIHDLRTKRKP
jgi:hypothetical protein